MRDVLSQEPLDCKFDVKIFASDFGTCCNTNFCIRSTYKTAFGLTAYDIN